MKAFFTSKEDFHSFEKQLAEKVCAGKGSTIQNNDGESVLYNVIQNELTAFQHNANNLQLIQRAICVDCSSIAPSNHVLEECSAAVQIKSHIWNVFPIKKCPESGETSIYCNPINKRKLITIAHQCKVANSMPFLQIVRICAFFASLGLSILVIRTAGFSIASFFTIGWSLCIATTFSCLFGVFLKERAISKLDLSRLKESVLKKRGCQEYKLYVSKIASEIAQMMPVAVIVDDSGDLDAITADIMEHIVSSGKIISIGAILWVVFHKQPDKGANAIIQKGAIPSKRFVLCRSITI